MQYTLLAFSYYLCYIFLYIYILNLVFFVLMYQRYTNIRIPGKIYSIPKITVPNKVRKGGFPPLIFPFYFFAEIIYQ